MQSNPEARILRLAKLMEDSTIQIEEFANEFLNVTLDAKAVEAEKCLALAPKDTHPMIHGLLKRFSEFDYFYGWTCLGGDSIEEQRRKQPHYRNVGNRLLDLLRECDIVEFGQFENVDHELQSRRCRD